MIGIVLATHGPLASAFIQSASLIMGEGPNIQQLGLYHGDSIEDFEDRVINAIDKVNEGNGVLVLTDLFGGSPCNITAKIVNDKHREMKIDCIYGINLPVFLEVVNARNYMDFDEVIKHVNDIFNTTHGLLSDKLQLHD